MGKVQNLFGYGTAGTPTRSEDIIIISVRNATDSDIPYGAPVFINDSWHACDVMEVLVRGSIALVTTVSGAQGSNLYIRKTDGKLVTSVGASGTTLLLENVRIRRPRTGWTACCEAIVNKRNVL